MLQRINVIFHINQQYVQRTWHALAVWEQNNQDSLSRDEIHLKRDWQKGMKHITTENISTDDIILGLFKTAVHTCIGNLHLLTLSKRLYKHGYMCRWMCLVQDKSAYFLRACWWVTMQKIQQYYKHAGSSWCFRDLNGCQTRLNNTKLQYNGNLLKPGNYESKDQNVQVSRLQGWTNECITTSTCSVISDTRHTNTGKQMEETEQNKCNYNLKVDSVNCKYHNAIAEVVGVSRVGFTTFKFYWIIKFIKISLSKGKNQRLWKYHKMSSTMKE